MILTCDKKFPFTYISGGFFCAIWIQDFVRFWIEEEGTRRQESFCINAHLSNSIVLWKSVIVKDGKHQRLVKGVGVRDVLEKEGLVEEGVESLPVHLGLKLLHPLGLRDEENLGKENPECSKHSSGCTEQGVTDMYKGQVSCCLCRCETLLEYRACPSCLGSRPWRRGRTPLPCPLPAAPWPGRLWQRESENWISVMCGQCWFDGRGYLSQWKSIFHKDHCVWQLLYIYCSCLCVKVVFQLVL